MNECEILSSCVDSRGSEMVALQVVVTQAIPCETVLPHSIGSLLSVRALATHVLACQAATLWGGIAARDRSYHCQSAGKKQGVAATNQMESAGAGGKGNEAIPSCDIRRRSEECA